MTVSLRVLVTLLAGSVLLVGATVAATPLPGELRDRIAAGSVVVEDRDGRPLREVRGDDGTRARWVPLRDVAPVTRHALLAAEDARFYAHPGVDPLALVRAAALDLWIR